MFVVVVGGGGVGVVVVGGGGGCVVVVVGGGGGCVVVVVVVVVDVVVVVEISFKGKVFIVSGKWPKSKKTNVTNTDAKPIRQFMSVCRKYDVSFSVLAPVIPDQILDDGDDVRHCCNLYWQSDITNLKSDAQDPPTKLKFQGPTIIQKEIEPKVSF